MLQFTLDLIANCQIINTYTPHENLPNIIHCRIEIETFRSLLRPKEQLSRSQVSSVEDLCNVSQSVLASVIKLKLIHLCISARSVKMTDNQQKSEKVQKFDHVAFSRKYYPIHVKCVQEGMVESSQLHLL